MLQWEEVKSRGDNHSVHYVDLMLDLNRWREKSKAGTLAKDRPEQLILEISPLLLGIS